ncbi:6707_t:CDS:10 [Paraglomus brasilianum]|uniref:Structural maintenance of chromosomes protein 5 n=1 Tax=Paraglomus brasilianum TaxID=144538 RepID=A0A9N9CXK6_9GLOM|nr:6707_t:CDS:10 [Paraglomus brasilianum]
MASTKVARSSTSSVSTIDDDYIEGSIVRVALTHFVTYDSVEFRPGPNLNMIIGPNGTGKSTIVCAIALGLGGHPSVLGRAREISDFVKHGEDRAEIEIELKSSPNLIIKRHIKKENNASTWRVNGEIVTQKEVLSRVGALNIQVNNLCQFLPQDKVSEFAQMSPPELLVETQRAVGDAQLGLWHESLKKLRNEEKDLALSAKGDNEQVENLEKRNQVLERDVTRFRERESIMRRRELDAQIYSLKERREKVDATLQRLKREDDTLRAEDEELRRKKHLLVEEKRQLMKERTDYERAKVKLQTRQETLESEMARPNYLTQAETQFRTVIQDFGRRRCRLVKDYQAAMRESLRLFKEKTGAAFKHMQAQAELVALARRVAERDDALREARAKFNDADRKFNVAKDRARQLLDEAKTGTDNLDEKTRQEFQNVGRDMTLEELEDELVSERAKAELYFSISPHIVQQYNQRKAEIDTLKEKLSSKESRLAELSTEMAAIRNEWESKLNEIVKNISSKFSEAFDKIGCAGEVRVSTHEDYDKWGIDILVKFRDHEKLQVLTGQRQSGGERSVSTIMYLMSLQELAKAPFRVVDEINQGMDPRNERMVHSQMVQAACRPNTSQYFLITPKLLPDLDYDERMKILCIYNGEWLPNKFDWQKYLNNKQQSGKEAKGRKRKAETEE